MKLLIVRHAIAMERAEYQAQAHKSAHLPGDVEAPDEERPLTAAGLKKMRKNARGLCALSEAPDMLVSSPLIRARQTAEVLCEAWPGLEFTLLESLKPASEPDEFAEWLSGRSGLVAIVGHEPHLSTLASWFLNGAHRSTLEIKKGGACLIEFSRQIGKARGELKWLAMPSMLRALR